MCLALPLQIIRLDGTSAVGQVNGMTQEFRVDFLPDIRVGDWAIVHAGFAIQKLTQQEADENIALLEECADALC